MTMRSFIAAALVFILLGCESAYYSAAEKVGIHKRDILVDRVEDSRDAQQEAEEQFQSALEHFQAVTGFEGGELEKVYKDLDSEYEDSAAAAEDVRERIDAVSSVADALFREWEAEIEEYSNASLKAQSQRQLRETRQRYDGMMSSMRRAESRMDPVLASFRDNVLFLKHNLNAQAVASLKAEFHGISRDVDLLIAEMRRSIAASDAFIESMRSP
jgi:Skp family chaperone for outer membrane proteins